MGGMLSAPVELTRVQRTGSSAFRAAVAEMQGWRDGHEDAHDMRCDENGGSFWVLDGHGGDGAALHCAPELCRITKEHLDAAGGKLPEDSLLEKMFELVDTAFRKVVRNKPSADSGSTVVGTVIRKGPDGKYSLKIMNAGDSRGLVVAPPTEDAPPAQLPTAKRPTHLLEDPPAWPLYAVTIDHKPDYYSEKNRIVNAGGFVSTDDPPRLDGNLAVSRGVGDFEYKTEGGEPALQRVSCIPDIYEVHGVSEGSVVVLACDGVWDVLTEVQVADIVRDALVSGPRVDLGVVAAGIVHRALAESSRDNITCMVIQLGDGSDWSGSSNRFNDSDEMMYFGKMLAEPGQTSPSLDEQCRKQYSQFLTKCSFPQEPVQCAVSGRWFGSMYRCPSTKHIYMNKHCQKTGWSRSKKGESVYQEKKRSSLRDEPDTF